MSAERGASPPGVGPHERVVLFDGVCNVCNAWVQFLIARDPKAQFRLASVQSPAGQGVLAWCGLPSDEFDTMVLVEDGKAYFQSTAFLRIVRRLTWPWPLLSLGIVAPVFVRDWLYDRLARNRYALFGKRESCLMPTPAIRSRFL
jgi:predicted DCC family thiol-disulfide oxidoreductase YuxK